MATQSEAHALTRAYEGADSVAVDRPLVQRVGLHLSVPRRLETQVADGQLEAITARHDVRPPDHAAAALDPPDPPLGMRGYRDGSD